MTLRTLLSLIPAFCYCEGQNLLRSIVWLAFTRVNLLKHFTKVDSPHAPQSAILSEMLSGLINFPQVRTWQYVRGKVTNSTHASSKLSTCSAVRKGRARSRGTRHRGSQQRGGQRLLVLVARTNNSLKHPGQYLCLPHSESIDCSGASFEAQTVHLSGLGSRSLAARPCS